VRLAAVRRPPFSCRPPHSSVCNSCRTETMPPVVKQLPCASGALERRLWPELPSGPGCSGIVHSGGNRAGRGVRHAGLQVDRQQMDWLIFAGVNHYSHHCWRRCGRGPSWQAANGFMASRTRGCACSSHHSDHLQNLGSPATCESTKNHRATLVVGVPQACGNGVLDLPSLPQDRGHPVVWSRDAPALNLSEIKTSAGRLRYCMFRSPGLEAVCWYRA
jgi:hypothetical protein